MIKTIRVQMLGGLSVRSDGEELIGISDEISKPWQLFCFVLLNRSAPCTQGRIAANLWRDVTPPDPDKTLRGTIQALNKTFGCDDPKEGPILFEDELFARNPKIEFVLDTEDFENGCEKAAKGLGEKRLELYTEAAGLYTGGLLPRLDSEIWVGPLARYYAKLYMECVTHLCDSLEAEERYTQLLETATAASLLEPLEERYYVYIFRALQALEMHRVIIPTYHRAARTFMEELGMSMNDEIQSIYEASSGQVDTIDQDIIIIKDDLLEIVNESRTKNGPLYCSYDVFKYLYQVVARSSERAGRRVVVLLASLVPTDPKDIPDVKTISMLMNQIKNIVLNDLMRRSDTVARFSQNQYIMMLSVESQDGADTVIERIDKKCEPLLKRNGVKIRFEMAEIDPPPEID